MSSELLQQRASNSSNHHHLIINTSPIIAPLATTKNHQSLIIASPPLKPTRIRIENSRTPPLIATSISLPNGDSSSMNCNRQSSMTPSTTIKISSMSTLNNNNQHHLRHRAHSPIEHQKNIVHCDHQNHITIASTTNSSNNNDSKIANHHQQQQSAESSETLNNPMLIHQQNHQNKISSTTATHHHHHSSLNPIIIISSSSSNSDNEKNLRKKISINHVHHQQQQQTNQKINQQSMVFNRNHRSPIITSNKIHSLIQQFSSAASTTDKESLSMTTAAAAATETSSSSQSSVKPFHKSNKQMSLSSYKNDDDHKANGNDYDDDNQRFIVNMAEDQSLPEGNVDEDDNNDDNEHSDDKLFDTKENESNNDHRNNENDDCEDDDDDEDQHREIVYEVDADDEQSNDMLEDDDDEDDDGPKSTSPGPVAGSTIVTNIDPSTKSIVQVISIMKNQSNNEQSTEDIASFVNNKLKEIQQESEDSAADVSYERTSDLAESDIEDTTTLTTVDTNNVNNLDTSKEFSNEQRFKITQTIWYLPHINRATVVHYLQGKSVGVFIVRQSSKPNTMAVSVRLPQGRGPHIEHYLIEKISKATMPPKSTSVYRLEGSEHCFGSILLLVLHYSRCQDELPVQLTLPSVLLNSSRSQLNSLALLGQEFWQSKFAMLKQLPKNSLNNETLAMINQNQQKKEELQSHPTKQCIRQPVHRNNSNSSESNQSKSSMSPMPPMIRPRRNTSDSVSPTMLTNVSVNQKVSCTPPPLPPKNPAMICDPSISSKSPIIVNNSRKDSDPVVTTTKFVEVHNIPKIKTIDNTPKLPPRLPNYVPPPVPPRNRNSPNDSTPPPPPLSSSFRSRKPQNQQKTSPLQDLLSPTSMTESEIEMAKFSSSHKIVSNILELDEYDLDDEEIVHNKSIMFRNYYNQMIEEQTSSPVSIAEEVKNQQTPSPAPLPVQHSNPTVELQSSDGPSSIKCDVCTQTYDTNKNLLIPNHQQPQSGRITRANSSLSCFYMDPIDALVAIYHQQPKRHSDPELASNSQNTGDVDSSLNPTFTMSHSLESLLENFHNRFATTVSGSELNSIRETILNERRNQLIQQHQNQQIKSTNQRSDTGFSTIDSAWQWHSGGQNVVGIHRPMPKKMFIEHLKRSSLTTNGSTLKSDITTVADLISAKAPELAVPKTTLVDQINQFGGQRQHIRQQTKQPIKTQDERERNMTTKSIATDVDTEFSEPWNIDVVESLFISEFHHNHDQSDHHIECSMNSNDTDTTKRLLNNDLINFNSFLLNQEQNHLGLVPAINEDDYDSVAEDEIDESVDNARAFKVERNDSENTLTDHNILIKNKQQISVKNLSSTIDDGIKLNIAYNISNYVFELASRKDNTFAKSIENFIECTKETTDPNPSVILGYVRQFMNGMKNYLLKHGEGDFITVVQNERSRLRPNQFLNIDSILEVSLQKLIIKPLKNFLYELFIRSHTMSGSLKILSTNIKLAQNKLPEELGIRNELLPIEPKIMAEIQKNLRRLQQSYSPIKKLEHLLKCIAILNGNYKEKISKCDDNRKQTNDNFNYNKSYNRAFSGDDLLPMLVYVIVHCGVISAEIESEYMLGLLHPSILNGEGSYYLTVLSSAIQVLKTMYTADNSRALENIIAVNNGEQSMFSMLRAQPSENLQRQMNNSTSARNDGVKLMAAKAQPLALPSIASMQAYMKIMIPNELTSNITCKTLPVRHNMTTKEVCRMIAHTFRITNPEDYALYRIKENGLEEIQLLDNEYPQVIKSELMARGVSAMFAYKRCDAKFIWPITSPN